jgi:hypothetical protein
MARVVPLLVALGALAGLGWLVRGASETEPHAETGAIAGPGSHGSEAQPLADPATAPPQDPEALASWFESQVRRELGARAHEGIDQAYLRDVFAGRVSGIPDERRAGLTLQEMDALGDIPYVEALRNEGRLDELRELGFEPTVIEAPADGADARFPLNPRLEPAN